jgi:hypothetical protein
MPIARCSERRSRRHLKPTTLARRPVAVDVLATHNEKPRRDGAGASRMAG